jgi:hypothetical protein
LLHHHERSLSSFLKFVLLSSFPFD